VQFCATQRESEMAETPSVRNVAQARENVRKSQNRPNPASRARKEIRGCLAKIVKKAASISELLTENDQKQNLRVIREAKKATHRIYDTEQKRLIEVPDHKMRLAAVALDLAYREGKPVERQIQVQDSYKEISVVLQELKQSPEARRLLSPALFEALEKASSAESAQQLYGEKDISDSEQKSLSQLLPSD
jgi:hypothetical protein